FKQTHIDLATLGRQMTKTNKPMPKFGTSTLVREKEVVFFSEAQASKAFLETRAVNSGLYKFRVSAHIVNAGKSMTLLIYAGNYGRGVQGMMTRIVAACDVTNQPGVVEFTARLGYDESISIMPSGMPNVYTKVEEGYGGPGLVMQWVEAEGPIIDTWPPVPAV